MHLISQQVSDKGLLHLIRRYLQCDMVQGKQRIKRKCGTPQGGPLSPLLSNILLNELDRELEKRGHRFVRYADDCSIFLKSKRSAERVLQSITRFLEDKLLLEVNQQKTTICRPVNFNLLRVTDRFSAREIDPTIWINRKGTDQNFDQRALTYNLGAK